MKSLLILAALLITPVAFADSDIECFNQSATYRFIAKEDGHYFVRIAAFDDKEEFGPFATEEMASHEAAKDCESLKSPAPQEEALPMSQGEGEGLLPQ